MPKKIKKDITLKNNMQMCAHMVAAVVYKELEKYFHVEIRMIPASVNLQYVIYCQNLPGINDGKIQYVRFALPVSTKFHKIEMKVKEAINTLILRLLDNKQENG